MLIYHTGDDAMDQKIQEWSQFHHLNSNIKIKGIPAVGVTLFYDSTLWVDDWIKQFMSHHNRLKSSPLYSSCVYLYMTQRDEIQTVKDELYGHAIRLSDINGLCQSMIHLITHQCACVIIDCLDTDHIYIDGSTDDIEHHSWPAVINQMIPYWCFLSVRYKMSMVIIDRSCELLYAHQTASHSRLTIKKR